MSDAFLSHPLGPFVGLVVAFTIKHFVCDFMFQTRWIACGKENRDGWVSPLLVHAGLHGAGTAAIALATMPRLWWVGIVDFAVHFAIDRTKCVVAAWGAWSLQDFRFWWLLGFDQALHQLTNVALAVALVAL